MLRGQHANKEMEAEVNVDVEMVKRRKKKKKKKTYDDDDVHDGLNKSGQDGARAAACRRVCGCLLKCFVDGPERANKSAAAAA